MLVNCSVFPFHLCCLNVVAFFFFFFNDTATTEIYTLSLHDALPICSELLWNQCWSPFLSTESPRSEEHTSELQSLRHLVCRLLLEKKNRKKQIESKRTHYRGAPDATFPTASR